MSIRVPFFLKKNGVETCGFDAHPQGKCSDME
jgi:hypothetical protein